MITFIVVNFENKEIKFKTLSRRFDNLNLEDIRIENYPGQIRDTYLAEKILAIDENGNVKVLKNRCDRIGFLSEIYKEYDTNDCLECGGTGEIPIGNCDGVLGSDTVFCENCSGVGKIIKIGKKND